MVLSGELHLLFLLTPAAGLREPNYDALSHAFERMSVLLIRTIRVACACDGALHARLGKPCGSVRRGHGRRTAAERRVAERVGLQESFVNLRAQRRRMDEESVHVIAQDRAARRLWAALILQALVAERPLPEVVRRFGGGGGSAGGGRRMDRGAIEELQNTAAAMGLMVCVIHRLEYLFCDYQKQRDNREPLMTA